MEKQKTKKGLFMLTVILSGLLVSGAAITASQYNGQTAGVVQKQGKVAAPEVSSRMTGQIIAPSEQNVMEASDFQNPLDSNNSNAKKVKSGRAGTLFSEVTTKWQKK